MLIIPGLSDGALRQARQTPTDMAVAPAEVQASAIILPMFSRAVQAQAADAMRAAVAMVALPVSFASDISSNFHSYAERMNCGIGLLVSKSQKSE